MRVKGECETDEQNTDPYEFIIKFAMGNDWYNREEEKQDCNISQENPLSKKVQNSRQS